MKKLLAVAILLFSLVTPSFAEEEKRFDIPVGNSPALGPANAPVTIIEFIDFQ